MSSLVMNTTGDLKSTSLGLKAKQPGIKRSINTIYYYYYYHMCVYIYIYIYIYMYTGTE